MDFKTLPNLMSANYFAIPDYQRDYSWTDAQNSVLIEDIEAILKKEENGPHFLGAIVTTPFEQDSASDISLDLDEYGINSESVKHVVDGQQRLTSLSVLLKATLDMKDKCLSEDEKATLRYVFNQAEGYILGSDLFGNQPAPRLILNGNTGKYYATRILKVRDDACNGSYRGAKRLQRAYDMFQAEIERMRNESLAEGVFSDDASFYRTLISVITTSLNLVEVECSSSTNAFQVFDSLNGKGLDLTAADRIKNIFLSWCPQGKKGMQKWSSLSAEVGEDNLVRFFTCLLFNKTGKRVSKRRMPDEFKSIYKDTAISDFDYFYKKLREASGIFSMIKYRKTKNKDIDERLLRDLDEINQEQATVMLMAAPLTYGTEIFKSKEYVDYVEALVNLVVRMQVCQKSTNKLDAIFVECLKKMANDDSIKVITNLIQKKQSEIADDSQFKAAFEKLTFSDTSVATYYLRKIEERRREVSGNRSPVPRDGTGVSTITVEHVIPQTLDDLTQWYGENPEIPKYIEDQFTELVIQSVGNMALMYLDDNSAAHNNSYSDKLKVYKNGSGNSTIGTPVGTFKAIEELVNNYPERFEHDQVFERATELAGYAVEIWC